MDVKKIKEAKTDVDIHPLIAKRWSPLAFADKMISDNQMKELFEAARWAASAYNEQPWHYAYAFRGTEGFDTLWNCLAEGNQPWTRHASVLVAAMIKTNFSSNGKPNPWAKHDLGLANAQLLMQAGSNDIYGHMMAGFDAAALSASLSIEATMQPVCMMALGFLGDPEQLGEGYKKRETSPRSRFSIDDFTTII